MGQKKNHSEKWLVIIILYLYNTKKQWIMKVNELRIGNYLNDRERNLCEVIELGKNSIYAPALNKNITKLPNEPIPLTEGWLLKFGFISNPYNDTYYLDSIYFENCKLVFECNKLRGFTELWIEKYPNIKYVHQLQNLYFTLTGTELEIKELAK